MDNESDFNLPAQMPGPSEKSPDNEYPDFPNEVQTNPEDGAILSGLPNVAELPDSGVMLVKYRRDPEGDDRSVMVESVCLPNAGAAPEDARGAMEDDIYTMATKAGVDIGMKGKPPR